MIVSLERLSENFKPLVCFKMLLYRKHLMCALQVIVAETSAHSEKSEQFQLAKTKLYFTANIC